MYISLWNLSWRVVLSTEHISCPQAGFKPPITRECLLEFDTRSKDLSHHGWIGIIVWPNTVLYLPWLMSYRGSVLTKICVAFLSCSIDFLSLNTSTNSSLTMIVGEFSSVRNLLLWPWLWLWLCILQPNERTINVSHKNNHKNKPFQKSC